MYGSQKGANDRQDGKRSMDQRSLVQIQKCVHGAFIRGNALIGAGCVVGNSTEIKNDILFNNVQVPHYNYCGRFYFGI